MERCHETPQSPLQVMRLPVQIRGRVRKLHYSLVLALLDFRVFVVEINTLRRIADASLPKQAGTVQAVELLFQGTRRCVGQAGCVLRPICVRPDAWLPQFWLRFCLLYTSDAADDLLC